MTDKPSLGWWVERIAREEMPIFGHTVQQVVAVSENEDAPSAELARVILQDASMTARTLKLANSPFYNPRERSISTVSRAVVVLGFDTVRAMCLSMALVDAFVAGGAPRERLHRELARSIHAAVQARALADARGDESPEEVFIATLLFHLGDLAFWCFSGAAGDELDSLQQQPGFTPEQAEEEVLGFRLRELTISLVREWRINELLAETLAHPEHSGQRGKVVLLSHRLATAAEQGWNAGPTRELVGELASLTGRTPSEVSRQLHDNAREAARVAALYGAATAARVIPLPGNLPAELEAADRVQPYPVPDGMLQLRILRELSSLLEGKAEANIVLELVLEGMYRGIGMDRTLFGVLTPARKAVRAKFTLGGNREGLTSAFHFPVATPAQHVFAWALERQTAVWVDTQRRPELERLVPAYVTAVTGRIPFYVAPIVVNGRSIGLFYADRALSGRALDDDSFESFKLFAQQASLALSHLAQPR